ncbi:MAG: MFS transporter [Planctomycetota bacterium]|nr:MFS transporter [Planctomycetota bacterium]
MKRRSPLLAVFLTVVIDLLGFGIVLPLLPLYGKLYDAQGSTLALLFISFSGMQFLTAPIWGRLSDRFGRRPIILVGLWGSFGSYTLFGLAPMTGAPLAVLFVSRLLAGTFGGTISTASAYIADVTSREERARGMALIGAAFGIGFTIGPAVGGLGDLISRSAPGFIAAGFSLLAVLYALKNLPEPERHREHASHTWLDLNALGAALGRQAIGALLTTGFIAVACFALLESTLSLLGKEVYDFSPFQVGLLFSYLGFWSAVNQGVVVRRLLKSVGEETLLVIGPILLAVGLLGIGVVDSLWALALLSPLPVLGFGMITPSTSSLLSRRTPPTEQGGVLGLNQSLQSLSRIIGPYAGIALFELSPPLPFYIGAGVALVPLLFVAHIRRAPPAERY